MADIGVADPNNNSEAWKATIPGVINHIATISSESHEWSPVDCILFLSYIEHKNESAPLHEMLDGVLTTIRKTNLKSVNNNNLSYKVVILVKNLLLKIVTRGKCNPKVLKEVIARATESIFLLYYFTSNMQIIYDTAFETDNVHTYRDIRPHLRVIKRIMNEFKRFSCETNIIGE